MTRGITVAGVGEIRAVPDIAIVSLGVEVTAPNARDARTGAANAAAAVLASLEQNNVLPADIQTASVTLQPQYDYNSGSGPVLRGYTATNTLSVTLRDLARSGEVIDEALEAGGNQGRLNNLRFSFSDTSRMLSEARKAAIADARSRAETFAEAAGVAVGRVVSVTDVSGSGDSPSPRQMVAELAKASPVEPGENTVSVAVVVRFAIL